jgi:hypothetical protein
MNKWFQEFIAEVETNDAPKVSTALQKDAPKSPLVGTDKTDKSTRAELESSRRRLDAQQLSIAVFDDGTIWIVEREQKRNVVNRGATLYTPEDILMYVTLSERERQMLHSFKKLFGGTTEWVKRRD